MTISTWRIYFQLVQTWFRTWNYRPIDQIRALWGQEGAKERWLASRLFELTRGSAADPVDDRT